MQNILDIEDLDILISTARRLDPLGSSCAKKRFEQEECSCDVCVNMCNKKPGFFDPEGFLYWIVSECYGEIDTISLMKALKKIFPMTKKDYCAQNGKDLFVIRPSTVNETPGKAPRFFTYSKCSLLGNSGCKLDSRLRPLECSLTYGCKKQIHIWSDKEASIAWQTPLGISIIKIYDIVGIENYSNYDSDEIKDSMDLIIEQMQQLKSGFYV